MQKWLTLSALSLVITFFLFAFMAFLVKKPPQRERPNSNGPAVEILNTERRVDTSFKARKLPPPPPVIKPIRTRMNSNAATTKVTANKNLIQNLVSSIDVDGDIPTNALDNPFGHGNADGDATPIVRVQPQYPIDAAMKGIEGWVKLSFSVDKSGAVIGMQVLDSSPAEIFDDQAKQALQRWLYRAKYVDGIPVVQNNLKVQDP